MAVGNLSLLGVAGWLAKSLITNRLTIDVERFKLQMKADADAEIERVKAFYVRELHVHERQLDGLLKLYSELYKAQSFFQRLTAGSRFEGEVSDAEYSRLLEKTIAAAQDGLLNCRLLIPPKLTEQCEEFFKALRLGQSELWLAQAVQVGTQRAEVWDRARKIAYAQIPDLLRGIDEFARQVIRGT